MLDQVGRYARDLYVLIEQCSDAAQDAAHLRRMLEHSLGEFLRARMPGWPREHFHVRLHPSTASWPWPGAIMRSWTDEPEPDLETLAENSIEIALFRPVRWYKALRTDRSSIILFVASVIHEFAHIEQFVRSGGNLGVLAHCHFGLTRPRVREKRVGKRGVYHDEDPVYRSISIEIGAHAADAAAEMIYDLHRLPTATQRARLAITLRDLPTGLSATLDAYRGIFDQPSANSTQARQYRRVWNLFRKKLAIALHAYVATLEHG